MGGRTISMTNNNTVHFVGPRVLKRRQQRRQRRIYTLIALLIALSCVTVGYAIGSERAEATQANNAVVDHPRAAICLYDAISDENFSDTFNDALCFEITVNSVQSSASSDPAGCEAIALDVPTEIKTSQKTYMDYRTITSKSSKQYKLQQDAWTDEYGFRRYGDYYMVALGTFYTGDSCGKVFRITLDTGVSFTAITGDVKADIHTDELNQHRNGNVVEFIVNTDAIPDMCRKMGDMSYANDSMFTGNIQNIEFLNAEISIA